MPLWPSWSLPKNNCRHLVRSATVLKSKRSSSHRLFMEQLESRRMLATIIVNSSDGAANDGDSSDGRCDTGNVTVGFTGVCTLRAAASHAAAISGMDTIRFNIPGSGVPVIDLARQVIFVSPVLLDATTQPEAGTVELRSVSSGPIGALNFILGSSGSTVRGFVINRFAGGISVVTDNTTIVGNRFGTDASNAITNSAIVISGRNNIVGGTSPEDRNVISNSAIGIGVVTPATDTLVRGNYIGTDETATVAGGNSNSGIHVNFGTRTTIEENVIAASGVGVQVLGSTASGTIIRNNVLGTELTGTITDPDGIPASGDELGNGKGIFINDAPAVQIVDNVISGSTGINTDFGHGIHFANSNASDAIVHGNMIGVDASGNKAIGNLAAGILIEAASRITIGGTRPEERNVISANGGDGVTIFGTSNSNASNNLVRNNYIGTDALGSLDLGNSFRGVHIDQLANGNVVGGDSAAERNLISGNDSDGVIIALSTSRENVVKGNYIGTDKDGNSTLGNSGSGIFVFNAPANIIGQSTGTNFVRNVISGNGEDGVKILGEQATRNVVTGNRIGTDKDGTTELPNLRDGVSIIDAADNKIGEVFALGPEHLNFPGNVIAAHRSGVRIEGAEAKRNEVLSNLIGVDNSGKTPWNTVAANGVHILDGSLNRIGVPITPSSISGSNTISNNIVGVRLESASSSSSSGGSGNFVAGNFIGTDLDGNAGARLLGNLTDGVLISGSSNNYIGGQPTGSPELPGNVIAHNSGNGVNVESGTGNVIQRNEIHSNFLLGIDLGSEGVTRDDHLDPDAGANDLQNAPFLTSVIRGNAKREIVGGLHGMPQSAYRIEIFVSDELDNSGFGEGQTFVGAVNDVKTDDSGNAMFSFQPPSPLGTGFLSATATDSSGNTSEFSCATRALGVPTDGHVFVVTNTNDSGGGSLRNAIDVANANLGRDVIRFCFGGSEVQTIQVESALPTITEPIIIDGLSHGDAACNTNPFADGSNANLLIEINGAHAGNGVDGLRINGGNSIVRGLVINGFSGSGIQIAEAGGNNVFCSYVGTNVEGTEAVANAIAGIRVLDSPDNTIGGIGVEALNLLSGNFESGVTIEGARAQNNTVDGNLIGTNSMGTERIFNGAGLWILDASNNVVGGQGNVISGSLTDGVFITDSAESGVAINNLLIGNRIGTNAAGNEALSNEIGVRIRKAAQNRVGGTPGDAETKGNLISGNRFQGVVIEDVGAHDNEVRGNLIGTDAGGTSTLPNGADGVLLGIDAQGNVIGGLHESMRNVISGNEGHGVHLVGTVSAPAESNFVIGNYIGTDSSGTLRLGNKESGVALSNARFNSIGISSAGGANLISANKYGIRMDGTATVNNSVEGNLIGTDSDGLIGDDPENAPLHNLMHGILITNASNNRIGAELDPNDLCDPGLNEPANTIAGNRQNGIRVDGPLAQDNMINCNAVNNNGYGLEFRGHGVVISEGSQNSIRRNSIFDNAGRGIDLNDDAISLNDLRDDDSGANGLQDYPVVIDVKFETGADGLNNESTWLLNSAPNQTYQIDFYSNDAPDPSGFGEGQYPLETKTLTTDDHGNGTVTLTALIIDEYISATATDSVGNTSEFSMVDTDGDALADAWETQGTDADENGQVDDWELGQFDLNEDGVSDHVSLVFLPGANPFHKDLFVEVDTMVESNGGPGLSQPTQAVLNVVNTGQMGTNDGFANAPNALVNNPDGADGITLHALISDQDVAHDEFNGADWASFNVLKQLNFGDTNERTSPNTVQVLAAKRLAYRYALFADRRIGNSISGVAELPEEWEIPYMGGNDLIVTLGGWGVGGGTRGGTAAQQQGTFMHELGHTLGLRHGGSDHFTFKPNYFSNMNYMWQTPDVWLPNWVLDYSRVDFGSLNENALNETQGVITTSVAADGASALAIAAGRIVQIGGASSTNEIFDQNLASALEQSAARKLHVPMTGAVDYSRLSLGPFNGPMNAGNVTALAMNNSTPHDNDMLPGTAPNADTNLSLDINGDRMLSILGGQEDWSKIRFYFRESLRGSGDGTPGPEDDHVEDFYNPAKEITMDYGDAPNGYPTLLVEDGARHAVPGPNNPVLGVRVDLDRDGQPHPRALADDESDGFDLSHDTTPAEPDDEDGVKFEPALTPGAPTIVTVTASLPASATSNAVLDAWIDFNADGDWDDANERVFSATPVVHGDNRFEIQIPNDATLGATFSRFRLSSKGIDSTTGAADDGEVEDHEVTIGLGLDINAVEFSTDPTDQSTLQVAYEVQGNASPPFEIAFYSSPTKHIGGDSTEIGDRISISDASQLTVGEHRLQFRLPALHEALADHEVPFVVAAIDSASDVVELDEGNNTTSFEGVFHPPTAQSPLIVRGNADNDSTNPKSVAFVETGSELLVTHSGIQSQFAVEDISTIVVLTYGGDDQVTYRSSLPFIIDTGAGHDTLILNGGGVMLDLTSLPAVTLSGIDSIDLSESESNSLTLTTVGVTTISDENKLRVSHGPEDTIIYRTGWAIDSPEFVDGIPVHVISDGESRVEISNHTHWHNPLQSLDSSLDGTVSPIDALLIINTINGLGSRELSTPTTSAELPKSYFDTNGDGFVSPIDALLVINFLNQSEGEGETLSTRWLDSIPALDAHIERKKSVIDEAILAISLENDQALQIDLRIKSGPKRR